MKSYAKINVFLKIVGTRANYHEIISRFVLLPNLYDEISFKKADYNDELIIVSNVKIDGENIIKKAFLELCKFGFKNELEEFFKTHDVVLEKNIPMGAGLGGGSSNAASFLHLVNDTLKLGLSTEKLVEISAKIGADVAFFASGLKSANVSGIGEVISEFEDDELDLEIFTPEIFSSTALVYKEFRANFMDKMDKNLALNLVNLSSSEILQSYKNYELNDLLLPCQKLYPELNLGDFEFLSGSGSSYFRVKGN
ncbi:4-(cytidine 5'-diphospho)-2-C-methyl-D-erythritol kinase [Campylobacter geochelonis]|uniref:4-(cytidine 5'-diphospho)-2-C-methyl-D-erythritol kinase n=1 Tax=Campylobacter geochelonis TaxID=1780362 RepID=UPI0007708DDE|nr:4-(cytidine 5'-diphospho)-2-C-methyl-D-erythritol kinase [Campylobacter geochelonis]CZE47535.1 4-diphosphocytidyl-2-C-methyl-D-erythritol kinase [Campylobacter geochelonis]CZE50222.1 4-diphosphocytidyl-2-C-methyl-D-erythritol kinase [Campylobacter geochelonis]